MHAPIKKSMMRVINIVPDVQPVRMGIWLPGVNVSDALLHNHGAQTEIWFPGDNHNQNFYSATPVQLADTSLSCLDGLIVRRKMNPENDIIITNSQWSFQHKWGYHLAEKGFKWVCMPHGTLQKWAMNQKWWKKKPYFHFVIKPKFKKVSLVRASGIYELDELKELLPGLPALQIPNGIEVPVDYNGVKENKNVRTFLFMARINFKKRVLQLTQAWIESSLNNNPAFELIIAGPDDGELIQLLALIKQSNNIQYIGPIYGDDKEKWLRKSTFYIMPSLLEGFATSVLEAASRACIPVISKQCNFPEITDAGFAVETGTEVSEIKKTIIKCSEMSDIDIENTGLGAMKFIRENYQMNIIAYKLFKTYSSILNNSTKHIYDYNH